MDMYQKRKQRKEKKNNPEKSGVEKNSINWVIPPFVNYLIIPLISRN